MPSWCRPTAFQPGSLRPKRPGTPAWPGSAPVGVHRGMQLRSNPSSPSFPLLLCVAASLETPPPCPLRSDLPHRLGSPVSHPPLHSSTAPTPSPWCSWPVGKIPCPRSTTRVTWFHEVSEPTKDSAPDGAPEWRFFTCDGEIRWWQCSVRGAARRWW
jgi:hypothetical protein